MIFTHPKILPPQFSIDFWRVLVALHDIATKEMKTYRSELYTCALELQELLNTNRKLYFEYQLIILSNCQISILYNQIDR